VAERKVSDGKRLADSRYELLVKIASGGMATVYVGRRRDGDARLWAIKRAHAHLIEQKEFRQMFIEEAQVASRIKHPKIVAIHDVEELGDELRLVMDYIEGGTLGELNSGRERIPPAVVVRIMLDAAEGLHAAHGMTDDDGKHMNLVHRDVSPHNILVGVDGVARLTDFGIAKCAMSSNSTTTGALKGKLGYMSPEYIEGQTPDQRHDVFALGIVLWELFAHKRLFRGSNEVETMKQIVAAEVPLISEVVPELGTDFDAVFSMTLARERDQRFENARAVAAALEIAAERSHLLATHEEVGAFLQRALAARLAKRRAAIAELVLPAAATGAVRSSTAPLDGSTAVADTDPMPTPGHPVEGAPPERAAGTTLPMAQAAPIVSTSPPSGVTLQSAVTTKKKQKPEISSATLVSEGVTSMSSSVDSDRNVSSKIVPAGVPGRSNVGRWLAAAGFMVVGGIAAATLFGTDGEPTTPSEEPTSASAEPKGASAQAGGSSRPSASTHEVRVTPSTTAVASAPSVESAKPAASAVSAPPPPGAGKPWPPASPPPPPPPPPAASNKRVAPNPYD